VLRVVLYVLMFVVVSPAFSQENSQTGDFNENYQGSTVNSNNTETSTTTNSTQVGSKAVPSAMAPSYMSSGGDTCLIGVSGGINAGGLSLSGGKYIRDKECEMRKNAKLLSDLGMKIASVALVCTEPTIWKSMFFAGTPCPVTINNKTYIGEKAYLYYKMFPDKLIPDYTPKEYDFYLGIGEYAREESDTEISSGTGGGILHLRSSRRNDGSE